MDENPSTRTSADGLDVWWLDFKETGDVEVRNRLVAHYYSLVEHIARQMASKMPRSVERDDLAQYGVFGLIDAIDKFEPDRGFRFETYAMSRIRGAIIDEIRVADWVPRSIRAKDSVVEAAAARLRARLNRNPTAAELADEVGDDDIGPTPTVRSLDSIGRSADPYTGHGIGGAGTTGLLPSDDDAAEDLYRIEELRTNLANAISSLPDKARIVLALYYREGFTFAEVGAAIGVKQTRVSQLHTAALVALREAVNFAGFRHPAHPDVHR